MNENIGAKPIRKVKKKERKRKQEKLRNRKNEM